MTTSSTTNAPRYIVVEGPIGVGKTSLARKLAASLSADLVLERRGGRGAVRELADALLAARSLAGH